MKPAHLLFLRGFLLLLAWTISFPELLSQVTPTPEQVKQSEQQMKKMSPQEIEAKVQALGMTLEQATTEASKLGIDLNSYLARTVAPTTRVTELQAKDMQAITTPDLPTEQKPVTETTLEAKKEQDDFIAPVGRVSKVTGEKLEYFGYKIFSNLPSAFEPFAAGPVDPEYLVGPGDVLRVSVWGQAEFQNQLEVDKEGKIFIPTIGQVLVSGMTLQKTYKELLKIMCRSYSGLVANPPTIWLDVTLGKLRPKRIFVMGEVRQPGGYTVNSYSTIFNSLFSVRGPKLSGSLREIRVIRNGNIIAHLDLYDYMIGSATNNDIRVQSNDIIYVPLRGRTVVLEGEVHREAIFELAGSENLRRLLEFGGGLRSSAYLDRVQISRIVPFESRVPGQPERTIVDVNLQKLLKTGDDVQLLDGDIVSVFPINDLTFNFVTIEGAVSKPGKFQLELVPTLRDLVLAADSLLPEAYLERVDIMRTKLDFTLQAISVNLGAALAGNPLHNCLLKPLDQVRVYSIHEINQKRFVTINGHVQNPGKYVYADSLTLYDLVFKAGGLTDTVYRAQTFLDRGDIFRLNADNRTRRLVPFSVLELVNDHTFNTKLEPGDEIRIYSRNEMKEKEQQVEISGRIRRPGKYPLSTNMTLYDLVYQAGGLLDTLFRQTVFMRRAELLRFNPDRLTRHTISFDLEGLIDQRKGDMLLEPDDHVQIYPIEAVEIPRKYVEVLGHVKQPGMISLTEDMTIEQAILRAGGFTEDAWMKKVEIARMIPEVGAMDSIATIIPVDLAMDEAPLTAARVFTNDFISYGFHLRHRDQIFVRQDPAFLVQRKVAITGQVFLPGLYTLATRDERLSSIISRSAGITPDSYLAGGRVFRKNQFVNIDFEEALDDPGGDYDIVLQPGDSIFIPRKPNAVSVRGEVSNPSILGYVDGDLLWDYIERSGGVTDSAEYALLQYPNGNVSKYNVSWFSRAIGQNPNVPDGSVITVTRRPPEKETESIDWGGTIKDIFAISASAITILALSRRL